MAGNNNFFPSASLTSSGRPVLLPNEVECQLISSVDLEFEDAHANSLNFPSLKSGILILTTHRLLWQPFTSNSTPNSDSNSISIPLSSVTHIFSLKKSIKSMFHSPRIRFQVSLNSKSVVVTVVARGKGDTDGFLSKFWESWRGRAWEADDTVSSNSSGIVAASGPGASSSSSSGGLYSSDGSVRMVGVAGILRKEQEMWENTDKSLQDAFQDLSALMTKAKDMVVLAEKMRQKLLSGSSSQSSEEMGAKDEMQDLLLSVGIISPVTKESAGALYHQQLCRQLADFVRKPLEKHGGMMNLIDVYCLFNRARGTELISPDDLLQACTLWVKFDVPVMLRKFDSGVMVIQNKSHSDEEVFARIKTLVTKPDALQAGITPSDAAMTLGIAPAMAKEHLLNAESKGILCRDISVDGFRFYVNIFPEIDFDDIHLIKDHSIYSVWVRATSTS